MNRWAVLSFLLLAATLVSAVDTALEARSGVAVVHSKTRTLTEVRGAPNSAYSNFMAWQVIRTLLLAGGLGCSLRIWRAMRTP